ncbi:MAG: glycosyltransferase family A protein, partial [Acidimicrobiia bacterium]|nr:glycosyltransferase family A protein [Acidimicrobiia bacterium]
MRVSSFLRSGKSRLTVLVVSAVLVVAATITGWLTAGAGTAAVAALLGSLLLVLVKLAAEVVVDDDRMDRKINAECEVTAELRADAERESQRQAQFNDAALNRIRKVESTAGDHGVVQNKMLDRVRGVESATGDLKGVSEAILDRVRGVESATGDLKGVSDAILDRVREVESSSGDLETLQDKILDRVRGVEAGLGEQRKIAARLAEGSARGRSAQDRLSPPGIERRVVRVTDLISQAMQVVKDSQYYAATLPLTAEPDNASLSAGRDSSPAVTVVVPCYNEERFAAEGLQSIQAQSYENWDCVVVDDGSTDGSADVIRATIEGDSRFRLIQQPENRGLVAARNAGIEATSGEYVVFHDIDDLMMRDSLADRVATLRDASDADVAGVFCGQRIADEGVRLNELPASEQWQPRTVFVDFVVAGGECPFGPSQAMLRTDVVRALGGFNKDFDTAEDWEFWLRIMRHGFVFRAANRLSVAYRQKWASMAQTGASRHVNRSVGLIDSAYTRVDLPAIDVPATYPFPEPLPHYQELLTRTRRAIQYASTALV